MEPTPEIGGAREASRLHVAVLHEDLSAGVRARQVIQEVARRINLELDFDLTLWRFDLLARPDLLPLAQTAALFPSRRCRRARPSACNGKLQEPSARRRNVFLKSQSAICRAVETSTR